MKTLLSRRAFLRAGTFASTGIAVAACAQAPQPAPQAQPPAQAEQPAQATEAPTVAPPAPEGAKLTMMWRTDPNEVPMVADLQPLFAGKNPGLTMETTHVPWDEFEPKLMTQYAAGAAPDVYGTGGTNPYIERWVRKMVLELNDFVDAEGAAFTDDLYPVGLNAYKKKGKLAALTFAVLASGVWMNASRFDEAGVPYPSIDWTDEKAFTWDDMIATAKQLTVESGGRTEKFGLQCGHATPWYYTRLWGQDVVSQEDYESGVLHKWQTDKPEVLEALIAGVQARADTMWKDNVAPSPDTANSLTQMGPMLKTGAIAMEFTGGWAVWGDMPKEFKFRAAINPKGGVGGSGTRVKNIWAEPLQISSQTKFPNEAWKWVRFMTVDPDAVKIELKYRNLTPVTRGSFDNFVEAQKDRLAAMTVDEQKTFYRGAIEQANTTVPDHILVGWAKVRDVFGSALEPVWLNEQTPEEAVNAMLPKIQAAIDANLKELGLT
jgi:multiple sugar transport system substrate-binding protein